MPKLRFWNSSNKDYYIIAGLYGLACFVLYIFGVLYIQFMLPLATFAFFPAILVHERNIRNGQAPVSNPSVDERWSRTKKELDKVSDSLDKAKTASQQKALQRQHSYLRNELRRIEWKVKESDMNRMYNASKGNLKELPDSKISEPGNMVELDLKKYEKILSNLIKEARKIVKSEPNDSRAQALTPVANNLQAYYNLMKKNDQNDRVRKLEADYFVVWAALSSFIRGVRVDDQLAKYTSKFRKGYLALHDALTYYQSNLPSDDQRTPATENNDVLPPTKGLNWEGHEADV